MEEARLRGLGNSAKSTVTQVLGGGRIPMEKPLSIKLMQPARAVFPEGVFRHVPQSTLLACLSELVGKDHARLPRIGDHSL